MTIEDEEKNIEKVIYAKALEGDPAFANAYALLQVASALNVMDDNYAYWSEQLVDVIKGLRAVIAHDDGMNRG